VIEWQSVDGERTGADAPAPTSAPTSAPSRVPLGQLLIDGGFIGQAQLDDMLYEGSRTGERLGEIVVRRDLASEDDVARLLAQQWGLDYVERSSIWFDPAALSRLSREDAQRLEALPTRVEHGHVVVAVAEPTEQRLAALRHVIGEETVVVVVPKTALDAGLRSELLASRGAGIAQPHVDEVIHPPPEEYVLPPPAPRPKPQVEDVAPAEPPLRLAPVADLPLPRPPGDADADAVVALANEARAVAERLAAQAAAVRDQANEQHAYENRITELEQQLAERTQQLVQVREQLEAVLRALNG
jgi:hypothetical protein